MSKKNRFKLPYIGIETEDDELHLLLGQHGEYSAVIRIRNPVVQYAANPSEYLNFHQNMLNILKILGEGFWLQKLDILSRELFSQKSSEEYLQQKYDDHFAGRIYTKIRSFLIITRPGGKRSGTAAKKAEEEFKAMVMKVVQTMEINGLEPRLLREREMDQLVMRILMMDFASPQLVLDNLLPGDTHICIGDKQVKCLSLIDIDRIDLPEQVSPYLERNDKEVMKGFPVDSMFFLHQVPGFDVLIYNQVLEIPRQVQTIQKLQLKKKRHSGIPDPENDFCVADIEKLLEDVARENQLLVNAHFSLVIAASESGLVKAVNNVENALFLQGIIPSRNSYNQLELFRSVLIGNAVELKPYDLYLTTSDAALSFFFKESLPVSEPAPKGFSIRFTDRQGIPVRIDPADYSREIGRINNRNKFVLGPSGSGKSFFMNALIEQYLLYNMDVVIVDTGDSYSGISSYLGGKYITYREEKPISMNPFVITREEFNLEKKDFLVTLVGLLWKGADSKLTQVESDVINEVVMAYYRNYFGQAGNAWSPDTELDKSAESFHVENLDFNSFYEFALFLIPLIRHREKIHFNLDVFRFVLKKFYKGGEFECILNEAGDSSLFDEPLIIFEIDKIKENKILFPIVTLIVMDVFIQKMRFRQQQRKALIIEEAWKAIASPMMAGYILYLYKTVRKFNGEAIVVTQELDDIISNPIVKESIINNSDTICLLDQTKFKDNYQEVTRLLAISEVEKRKIFTINNLDNKENRGPFKEVYIRRGHSGEVYGVEVSLFQYLTYTTEKPEKLAVESYVRSLGNYPLGLDAFVEDLKRSTLPLSGFVELVNLANERLPDRFFSLLQYYRNEYGHQAVSRIKQEIQRSSQSFMDWLDLQSNTSV